MSALVNRRPRVRIRRPTVSRTTTVVAPVLLTVVVMVGLALAGIGLDTSLGVAGLLFGLITLVLSVLREQGAPTKRIQFVGQDDERFNDNVLDGLRAATRGALPLELVSAAPADTEPDPVRWQADLLESLDDVDAVVVLPSGDDARIWTALQQLTARGVTIVVVDFEPPAERFADRQLPAPLFVASDFVAGGRMAGELIAERMVADPRCTAVVCLGPDGSRPGAGRSSQVLYVLARRGLVERVRAHELTSWNAENAAAGLAPLVRQPAGPVVVFCGDDRILLALSRRAEPDWAGRVTLVGYDGARGVDGRYLARDSGLSIGTIDTDPVTQGRAAGLALIDAYQGRARDQARRVVAPHPVTAPDWR